MSTKPNSANKVAGNNKRVKSSLSSRSTESLIEIEALRLASDGSGVGKDDVGITTFVPGLLPGEIGLVTITERKKNWQRGELQELIKRSPERVDSPCQVFASCGGCQLQHLDYQETLKWKRIWVEDALKRIGKLDLSSVTVHPTLGMDMPWRYRNKARLHLDAQGNLGYYRQKTNDSVAFPDCLLLSERMNRWIKCAEQNLFKLAILKKGTECELTWRENTQGEGLLILESGSGKERQFAVLDPEGKFLLQKESGKRQHEGDLPAHDDEEFHAHKVEGLRAYKAEGREMHDTVYLTEEIVGLKFRVSPLAFLQVNSRQTEVLYAKALEYAAMTGKEYVWDLYCGIGTITLALARHAREVVGIEENPYAVEDAIKNAALNGLDNVRFIQGKTEERLKSLVSDDKAKPDVIVLDPPRAGVDAKGLEQIINAAPQRIVYVSCDPGTLARDLGRLAEAGYKIHEVQPVDMFPWSYHVECVTLMSRAKNQV